MKNIDLSFKGTESQDFRLLVFRQTASFGPIRYPLDDFLLSFNFPSSHSNFKSTNLMQLVEPLRSVFKDYSWKTSCLTFNSRDVAYTLEFYTLLQ